MPARGKIDWVEIPRAVTPGEMFSWYVYFRNIGDERGWFRVVFHNERTGETARIYAWPNVRQGLGRVDEVIHKDATFTFQLQRRIDTEWVTDDTATATVTVLSVIEGYVKDAETGKLIDSARIEYDGYTAYTNSEGYYRTTGLQPKTYTVSASKPGYIRQTKTVNASPGGIYRLDFNLEKEIVPPVEWIPIAIGGFAPIIFGLALIGGTELTKR